VQGSGEKESPSGESEGVSRRNEFTFLSKQLPNASRRGAFGRNVSTDRQLATVAPEDMHYLERWRDQRIKNRENGNEKYPVKRVPKIGDHLDE
jgi:hypothetical protein